MQGITVISNYIHQNNVYERWMDEATLLACLPGWLVGCFSQRLARNPNSSKLQPGWHQGHERPREGSQRYQQWGSN